MSRIKYDDFLCDCRHQDHVMWVSGDEDFVYVNFRLNDYLGFFKKLHIAVMYLFGKKTDYKSCAFDDVLLNKGDAERLVGALQDRISRLK